MKRTQLITLLLVLFTGIGVASAKPKVAVLGLEVLDKTNTKPSIDAARQVTEGLRLAAKVAGGPLELADNSQHEFLDEKIFNQCESEQRECLNKIATNFGATALMYGKLQLSDNKKSFQVTVWLLTVDKSTTKTTSNVVPITASAQELQSAGKKMYGDLVGLTNQGSIAIKSKASKGIVYLNGDMKGQLVDGEYKATQLADGEYRVRITADGFKKWEETVRVKGGQTTSVEPTLEAEETAKPPARIEPEDKASRSADPFKLESRENTLSHGRSRKGWKIAAIGSTVVAAGSLGFVAWQFSERGKAIDKLDASGKAYGSGGGFFGQDCETSESATDPFNLETLRGACDNTRNMWIGGTVAGAAGVVAVAAFYMGYVRSDSSESNSATSLRRPRKERFAVTPIVSPDGGGATFRIDF